MKKIGCRYIDNLLKLKEVRKAGNECLTSEAPLLGASIINRIYLKVNKSSLGKITPILANYLTKWAQECDAHQHNSYN